MRLVIGAVLGLLVFVAVILLGMMQSMDFATTLARAGIAFVVALVLGMFFFGPAGELIMHEAAGGTGEIDPLPEEAKEVEEETKKDETGTPKSGTGSA